MISNQEINEIIKIVKSLEVSGILIKDVTKTIKNEAKKQKGWIFGMLLCNFCASLLENNLGQEFSCHLILSQILKYKYNIKMKLNLIEFIPEIVRGWGIC